MFKVTWANCQKEQYHFLLSSVEYLRKEECRKDIESVFGATPHSKTEKTPSEVMF